MEGSPRDSHESLKKHDHVVQWLNLGPKSLRRRTKKDISGAKAKRVPSVDLETLAAEIKKKPESKKLKKKLNDIFAENDALAKALKDKNTEIADLRRSVQSLNDVLNSVPIDELRCNSSIASTKILELSKKNRSLRAELETAKSRLSKKDVVLQKAERDLGLLSEKYKKLKESADRKATGSGAAGSSSAELLQAKTTQLQQKVFESRNKITELQTQLKLAHKCLQQEVGENVNVNTLMNGPTSWRGRAQQILHLQQRVHELKERLDAYERGPALMPPPLPPHGSGTGATTFPRLGGGGGGVGVFRAYGDPGETSSMGTATSPKAASEQHASNGVRRTELQHRAKVDKLEKEMAELREQLAESRQKILGLKVRNKTINDELLKYKMKTSTLEEQTDYHGINLDRLNDELNAQKQCYEQRLQQLSRKFEAVIQQREQLEMQLEEVTNQMDNLRQVVGERDAALEQRELTIEALQADMKALCGDFLFACRDFRRDEFLAILEALEYEKCGLVEHVQSLETRLAEERARSDSLAETVQKYKLRFCRLEAKTREMAKELESQAERRKRSQRVAEYANSLATSPSVTSFVFENSAAAGSTLSGGKKDVESCLEFIELRHQLEFANEKISMLGERLCNLLEEKHEDANKFEAIIRNTKTVILETISGRRQTEAYAEGGGGDEAEHGIALYTPLPVIHEQGEETGLRKSASRTNTSIAASNKSRTNTNNYATNTSIAASSNNNYATNNNNCATNNNNCATNNNNYATNNNNYATNNNCATNNNYATNNNNYATNNNNNNAINNNNVITNTNANTNNHKPITNNNANTTKNNNTSSNKNTFATNNNNTFATSNNNTFATNNNTFASNNTMFATNNNTPFVSNTTTRTIAASP